MSLTMRFGNPVQIVLNILAIGAWIAAVVDLRRTPRGWKGRRRIMFVVVCLGVFLGGVYVPVGPAFWFIDRRKYQGHAARAAVAPVLPVGAPSAH
ncbi:MAG TPA: hypothetical protein VGM93_10585 [Acidimicrobiales bacterium]